MDTKAANPGCVRGSRRRSRFVITLHRDNIAFAIIGNKFSSDVLSNAADDRGLSSAFEREARSRAEFRDPEYSQSGNPADEKIFLQDGLPSMSRKKLTVKTVGGGSNPRQARYGFKWRSGPLSSGKFEVLST